MVGHPRPIVRTTRLSAPTTPPAQLAPEQLTPMPPHDIFFSYRTNQAARAGPILDALAAAGLTIWRDLTQIRSADSLTDEVRRGLTASRVLVVFATEDWPRSKICAAELSLAWIAAERLHTQDSSGSPPTNAPARRVLLFKPHDLPSLNHLCFGPLADCCAFDLPDPTDAPALAAVAQRVKTHLDTLDARTFADAGPTAVPAWIPRPAPISNRFVGRDRELWQLHAKLTRSRFVAVTGHQCRDTTQLRGLGGLGKTLLASHYAHHFAGSWPGGIFWLHADPTWTTESKSDDDLRHRTNTLLDRLAEPLHVQPVPGDLRATAAAVRKAIADRTAGTPYLWVLDNVPAGTSQPLLEALGPPTPDGAFLITTRYMSLGAAGEHLDLTVLDPDAAFTLLTTHRKPTTPDETTAAHALATDVGHHPLALDVLAGLIRLDTNSTPYAQWRTRLAGPGDTTFDTRADALKEQLPTGCERSITRVLETSLAALTSPLALDILRLAALLANAPIPLNFLVNVIEAASRPVRLTHRNVIEIALDDLLAHALITRDDDTQTLTVHNLVQWVAERWKPDQARQEELTNTATSALLAVLSDEPYGDLLDIRTHDPRLPFVPHALHLTTAETEAAATISHNLGNFFHVRGDFAAALAMFERALAAREHILGPAHLDSLASLQNLAGTLSAMGDFQRAVTLYERALADHERILGPEHQDTLITLQNFAGTIYAMGDFQRARALYDRALIGFDCALGSEHPITLKTCQNLAGTLKATGDIGGAHTFYKRALAAQERILDPEHPDTIYTLQNLAGILKEMKDLPGSRLHIERALDLSERILGPKHPDTLNILQNLAIVLKAMGDLQGARSLYERALDASERIPGSQHPDTLNILHNLAGTLKALGDLEGARSHYQRVVDTRERILGPLHSDTCVTRFNLILTLEELDPPAAHPHIQALLPLLDLPLEKLSADQQKIRTILLNSLNSPPND